MYDVYLQEKLSATHSFKGEKELEEYIKREFIREVSCEDGWPI